MYYNNTLGVFIYIYIYLYISPVSAFHQKESIYTYCCINCITSTWVYFKMTIRASWN